MLQNSSSSDSSRSEWECSDAKQSASRKAHFSVTSCDTGLKLKIAAIPPRKVSPKRTSKPSVKKKLTNSKSQSKERTPVKKKSQLSDTTSSSESCSKCSSDSSSDDDLPLKAVSKSLPSKCSAKSATKVKSTAKIDEEGRKPCDLKDNGAKINNKEKQCGSKNNSIVKKTKSDESSHDVPLKRGRGRPRTKVSLA